MLHRIRNDREGAQPQKVHLEKPQSLDIVLVELRDERALGDPDGHLTRKRIFRNHNARRMDGGIARQPFDLAREVDHPVNAFVLVVDASKIRRLLECAIQCDIQLRRYELCDCRNLTERHFEHAPDITNRALCPHCTKGGDLRDMILAVALLDIRNHPTAINIVKVDINIRHGHAFGVEETLKEERILQGVDIRDPEEVGDNAASRRAAPGADGNAVLPRVVDEVPYDEEVARISHVANDAKLIGKALTDFIRDIRIALRETLLTECTKIRVVALIGRGQGIERELQFSKGEVHLTARSNLRRVLNRPRIVRKERRHLLLRFQIVIGTRKLHAVRIVDGSPCLHAEENVMKFAIVCMDIVHIICCNKANLMFFRKITKRMVDCLFLRQTMILYLEKEVLPTEDLHIFTDEYVRLLHIPAQDCLRNFPRHTGRERNNSLVVFP